MVAGDLRRRHGRQLLGLGHPQLSQPTEPPGQSSTGSSTPTWDPPEIYAAVIRQLYTVDHTFGKVISRSFTWCARLPPTLLIRTPPAVLRLFSLATSGASWPSWVIYRLSSSR